MAWVPRGILVSASQYWYTRDGISKGNWNAEGDGAAPLWGATKKALQPADRRLRAILQMRFTKSQRQWVRWMTYRNPKAAAIVGIDWNYTLVLVFHQSNFFHVAGSALLKLLLCESRYYQQVQKGLDKVVDKRTADKKRTRQEHATQHP